MTETQSSIVRKDSSTTYISHFVLHEKHPLFKKLKMYTLRSLMDLAQFIYLGPGEKIDTSSFIYFIVFGRLNVKIHGVPKHH
jgi:hypothetical protein